jgi:PAS domain S-box-containing protein
MDYIEQFQQESRQLHHQRVYFILAAGIVVMLLFTLLDALFVPNYFEEFLRCRIFSVGIGILLLIANYYDQAQQKAWAIGFAGYLCVGIVILLTVHRLGEVASPYYVGLIVAMTVYTTLAPLTVTQTLISGFALVFLYLIAILFVESFTPYQLMSLFNHLFFMVCFVLIAATQSWADTAARGQECLLRASEKEAAEALAYQAGNLEHEVKRRAEEHKATEKHYQILYEAIADDVVLFNPQGQIMQANSSYLRHFAGGKLQAGASFFDTVSFRDLEKMQGALAESIDKGVPLAGLQCTLTSAQGLPLETEISGALLRRGEQILGVQLVIRDISVRKHLEEQLIISLSKVKQTENAAILALAKLSEYRDITPGHHLERIREYCKVLAIELARRCQFEQTITTDYVQNLYQGAILHDIGKVAIADDILCKTGVLSVYEEEILRNHTLSGGDVIKAMEQESRGSGFLSLAKNIAYFHHECWDGQGYPYGLQGTEIPLEARIMALADAYEELTAAIDPEKRLTHHQALGTIVRSAGHQFDSDIVDAFVIRNNDFDRIRRELAEPA